MQGSIPLAALYRRIIVLADDEHGDLWELLESFAKARPRGLRQILVVCLAHGTSGNESFVQRCLDRYPELQVACRIKNRLRIDNLVPIPSNVFQDPAEYASWIAQLVRPRGLFVQDLKLKPLEFVDHGVLWSSAEHAANVRGRFPEGPPTVWLMSKENIFPLDLEENFSTYGFRIRDWMTKDHVVNRIVKFLDERFPWRIISSDRPNEPWPLCDGDKAEIGPGFDLVLRPSEKDKDILTMFGPALTRRLDIPAEDVEARVWRLVIKREIAQADVSKSDITAQTYSHYDKDAAYRTINRLNQRLQQEYRLRFIEEACSFNKHLQCALIDRAEAFDDAEIEASAANTMGAKRI